MTKRWNDQASDASELERSLLASAPDAEPPAGAEQQVWQSLAAVLAVPPAPAGAESAAQHAASGASAAKLSGASTLVTLGKGFALGVGVSLAVAGVVRLGGTDEREAPPSAAAVPTNGATAPARLAMNPAPELPSADAPSPLAVPAAVSRGVAPSPVVPSGSTVAAPPVEARATASSSVAAFPVADARGASRALEEEAALLRRARSELRGGRLAEAFATLEASRERFSLPELAQEREALLIELLYRSGEPARAAEKARSFLSRYPESPHAAKLRSIAAPAGAR